MSNEPALNVKIIEEPLANVGPIFIGRASRSGKTYLRMMLSEHPNIVITRRTNLWPLFYNKFGRLSQENNFEHCLLEVMSYKHVRSLELDPGKISLAFRQGTPSYARLFALINEEYARKVGKTRWGDQTELIERYADLIYAAYPNARIIHLVRDPRDRFEACLTRKPDTRTKIGEITSKWLYSTSLARRNLKKYKGLYSVVRYEDMVSSPEETLRQVCNFLNEKFTPSMITLENVPRFRKKENNHITTVQSPLTTDYIGRFQKTLTQSEIAFIQKSTKSVMQAFNYPIVPLRLSTDEWINSHLLNWPVYLGRMAAWFILRNS